MHEDSKAQRAQCCSQDHPAGKGVALGPVLLFWNPVFSHNAAAIPFLLSMLTCRADSHHHVNNFFFISCTLLSGQGRSWWNPADVYSPSQKILSLFLSLSLTSQSHPRVYFCLIPTLIALLALGDYFFIFWSGKDCGQRWWALMLPWEVSFPFKGLTAVVWDTQGKTMFSQRVKIGR